VPRIPADRVDGVFSASNIPALTFDASAVTTGTIAPERLPDIHASKIHGRFDVGAIPNLDANKIVTGRIRRDQIPELDASAIVSGTLDPGRLPPLGATDIGRGIFNPGRIPYLDASKITTGTLRKNLIPRLDPEHMPPLQSMCVGDLSVPGSLYASYATPEKTTSKKMKNSLERVRTMQSVIDASGVPRISNLRNAFPEAFKSPDEDVVDYSRIIPLLVEAIKDLDLLCSKTSNDVL
jgi:hypothetical protein